MTVGSQPVQVVCTKCGHANKTDDTFCGACGAYLEWNSEHLHHENPIEYRAGQREEGPKKSIIERVRAAVLDPDEDAPRVRFVNAPPSYPPYGAPEPARAAPIGSGPAGVPQSGGYRSGSTAAPPDPSTMYTGASPPISTSPASPLEGPLLPPPGNSGPAAAPPAQHAPAWGRGRADPAKADATAAKAQAEQARRQAEAAQAARLHAEAEHQARVQAEHQARERLRTATQTELGRVQATEAAHIALVAAQHRSRQESEARARAEAEARVRQEAAAKAASEAAAKAAAEAGENNRLAAAEAELAELAAKAAATNDPTAKARYAAQIDAARERATRAARSAEVARTVRIEADQLAQLRQEAHSKALAGVKQQLALERSARDAEQASSNQEIELRCKVELETQARIDAEQRAKQEERNRRRAELEARSRRDAAEKARREFEERQRRAADLLARPLGQGPAGPEPQPIRPGQQEGPIPYQGVGAMPAPVGAGGGYGQNGAPGTFAWTGTGADVQHMSPLQPQESHLERRVVGAVGPERARLRAGDLICGECGEGNDPDRHFCRRCGSNLAGAKVQETLPWHKRLWQALTHRKPKTYKATDRPDPARKKRARRRFWSRIRWTVAIVCAVLLLIGFAVPEYRRALNEAQFKARRSFMAWINPKYYPQRPTASACSSYADEKLHDAGKLTDGFSNTWWLSAKTPEKGVGQVCVLKWQTYVTLRGSFWHSGAGGQNYDRYPAPTKILLNFSNGEQQTVDLQNNAKAQRVDLKEVKAVAWVKITIQEVAQNGGGETSVALSEVEFVGVPTNKSILREPPPPAPLIDDRKPGQGPGAP